MQKDPKTGPAEPARPYLKVAILLAPGFTLNTMANFIDTLRLAADREDRSRQLFFAWDFISLRDGPAIASCALEVLPTARLEDLPDYDAITVCGGLMADYIDLPEATAHYLREASEKGLPIVGLCTGIFCLAQAGLLDNRRAAVHFDVLGEFVKRHPRVRAVTREHLAIDRNIITASGSQSAVKAASYLIGTHGDHGRARKALSYLLFEADHSDVLQMRPYSEALAKASQLTIHAVQAMEFRLDARMSIDELAGFLNTDRATLSRAFRRDLGTAPATFWRRLRLYTAREALLGQRRSITEIAYDVGFYDTAHFCNVFRKQFGVTPQDYRNGSPRAIDWRFDPDPAKQA